LTTDNLNITVTPKPDTPEAVTNGLRHEVARLNAIIAERDKTIAGLITDYSNASYQRDVAKKGAEDAKRDLTSLAKTHNELRYKFEDCRARAERTEAELDRVMKCVDSIVSEAHKLRFKS